MRTLLTPIVLAATLLSPTLAQGDDKPPRAERRPTETRIQGEVLHDDYAWLRDKKRPEVLAYLKAENAYAAGRMQDTKQLESTLFGEMKARVAENTQSAPWPHGEWEYFTRMEAGQQYPVYCRQLRGKPESEQRLVDANLLARGKRFMHIEGFEPSPDNRLVAYTSDDNGYRQYRLHVLDTRSGHELPRTRERVTSLAWSADGSSLFFTTEDKVTKRSDRAWRMDVASGKVSALYTERDALYNLNFDAQRSGQWVLLTSFSYGTTEVRAFDARKPSTPARVLMPRRKGIEYYAEHRGDEFWLRINDTGRNFRLVRVPQDDVQPARFAEVLPARNDVTLTHVDAFADQLLVAERSKGLPQLAVVDPATGSETIIAMPEAVYEAHPARNDDWQSRNLRFEFESFTTPLSTYAYDAGNGQLKLLHRQAAPNFKPEDYESARIEITARDGTPIPVSLVWKRGARDQGPAPMLLSGYGAYGIPYDIEYREYRASILDRGMVFAVAHVRGGGDLGKTWHDAGRMLNKKNSFTDFVDVAEGLVNNGVTTRDKLAITGGSAGGLLMGAVTNLRPDLFKVVLSYVPFVDVINTMLDESLPLTTAEFEEWGNPKDPRYYAYMRSYSPYDNIEAKAYPIMLVKTSLNDSQVGYWEPAKYVAKLRATRTDDNELLLMTNLDAGHGGASGRYDHLREMAFDMAFVLSRLGVVQ